MWEPVPIRAHPWRVDIAIQTRVVGTINFDHPTLADKSENFVRAEFVADRKGTCLIQLSVADQKAWFTPNPHTIRRRRSY